MTAMARIKPLETRPSETPARESRNKNVVRMAERYTRNITGFLT